jgi:hypothetical protein
MDLDMRALYCCQTGFTYPSIRIPFIQSLNV